MKYSKYNSEGYYDPTTYEALTNIEKSRKTVQAEQRSSRVVPRTYRPLVYICSPYSDDILNNERKARVFSKFAVKQDAIPVTPHLLYPQFMDESDPAQRELGLFFATVLLTKCEQVWVFGSRISKGMAREIYKAETKGISVRYFTEDCEEVQHGQST